MALKKGYTIARPKRKPFVRTKVVPYVPPWRLKRRLTQREMRKIEDRAQARRRYAVRTFRIGWKHAPAKPGSLEEQHDKYAELDFKMSQVMKDGIEAEALAAGVSRARIVREILEEELGRRGRI